MAATASPCAQALSARCSAAGPQKTTWVAISARCALSSEFAGARLTRAAATSQRTARRRSTPAVCQVSVGDPAPDVTLVDQNGRTFSLAKLKGKKNVVLYFYPADDTPGCTKQACSFRDSFDLFRELGAEVVGISGDSPESHATFAEKYDLPYTLLSDEGNEVRKEFGVPSDLFGFLPGRQTYVIDKKGVVQLIFNNQFQPEKHIEETAKILEELKDVPDEGFKLPQLPQLPKLPKFF